ncbi:MAG: putative nucleic-acid-binding protein containing a Zn-ribbon [Actinomycetia bacterium]|nr:putative nucleic-acid-binding protein containing a Zn-ribbon [Actinomycetes bacterium]
MAEPLVADHVLEYPGGYTRSVGPVIGRFLTSLRDGRIEGVRLADGRVLVPPTEYDPLTSNPVGDDWVAVGPRGVVQSWTWVERPRPGKHGLDRPFAFALIRPDGADTAMVHVVDAGSADVMSVGMRVMPRWRAARVGSITDIEAWVPLADGEEPQPAPANTAEVEGDTVNGIVVPIRLEYRRSAGVATTRYLLGLKEHKILGERAPSSQEVYAASRGTDPKTGEPTSIVVEVQDRGTITTFCVVNIPGLSPLAPEVPYVSAQILLDGANNTFFGLIRGVPVDDVRMGMRVQAVWADELVADHTSIKWWEPLDEPDASYDSYKGYL